MACPFRGLWWQCSCANTRLDLSLGRKRGRRKRERVSVRAWYVANMALTSLSLGRSPLTAPVIVIALMLQTFPFIKTFLGSDQPHIHPTVATILCYSFFFYLHFPVHCCWSQWLATEKRLRCSTPVNHHGGFVQIWLKIHTMRRLTVHRLTP